MRAFVHDTIRSGLRKVGAGGSSGRFGCETDEIADRTDGVRGSEIADATVQVQPELPGQHVVGGSHPVLDAALLEDRQVQLLSIAAEDRPGYFDVAVGGNGWGCDRRRVRRSAPPYSCRATLFLPVLASRDSPVSSRQVSAGKPSEGFKSRPGIRTLIAFVSSRG